MNEIAHLTTYLEGGAAIAARRILDGLKDFSDTNQWDLQLFCRDDQSLSHDAKHIEFSDSFFSFTLPKKLARKSFKAAGNHYHTHLKDRPAEFEAFSPARHYSPTPVSRSFRPDLIHLHWVAFWFDYPTFFRSIPKRTPIVWTLHDMNPFTGGCHYSHGCEKFVKGCGDCFQIQSPGPGDLSAVSWSHKAKAYRDRNLTIVSPSRWLLEEAKKSPLFPTNTRYEIIRYGLELKSDYYPVEKNQARQQLGIDSDAVILMFGADNLEVTRKGMSQLKEALLSSENKSKLECVVFGNGDLESFQAGMQGIPFRSLGFLDSVESKRLAYSAADLFLLPSLEDNQPQTGLEAMACGTPVVAFDSGGISDFVRQGQTGLLAPSGNSRELSKAIDQLVLNEAQRREFGIQSREVMESEFEIKSQTEKYLDLYSQLL